MHHNRKLLAVLFADVAGYTAMMHKDEDQAILVLNHFKEALTHKIAKHKGKIWQFYGDGCLATFESASDAVECSLEIQQDLALPPIVNARIGLHMGDVVVGDDNIHGDSVNIASRIESMGVPNSVLFSNSINDQIKNKLIYSSESLGEFNFKNISEPLEVYALKHTSLVIPDKNNVQGKFAPPKRNFKKTAIYALSIIALFIIGAFAIFKFSSVSDNFKDKTIAVFPFRTWDASPEYQNYCRGLMLAIHSNLSKIKGISLLSIGDILGDGNNYPKNEELLSKLDISNFVAGSLNSIGDEQTVTSEFINAQNKNVVWANTIKIDNNKNFFSLVNDVAAMIVDSLRIEISPEKKKDLKYVPTSSTQAYSLLVQAKKLAESRTKDNLNEAVSLLSRAIELDNEFAQAYAELANTVFAQGYYKFNDQDSCYRESERLAKHAIEIYDQVFTAHSVLATIAELVKKDKNEAREMYIKALDVNPNDATGLRHYSVFLKRSRLYKEALALGKKSAELSPYNAINNRNYIDLLIYNEMLDEAKDHLEIMVDRLPNEKDDFAGYFGDVYSRQGEYKKAIPYYEKRLESRKTVAGELGYCYGRTGNTEDARSMIHLVPEGLYRDVNVAMIYAGMASGNNSYTDSAYYFINKAIGEDKGINVLCDHPFFEKLTISYCK